MNHDLAISLTLFAMAVVILIAGTIGIDWFLYGVETIGLRYTYVISMSVATCLVGLFFLGFCVVGKIFK